MRHQLVLTLLSAGQKAISLVGGVVIGRFLGAADYGVFSLVRSIAETLVSVARGGFDLVITKDLARYKDAHEEQAKKINQGLAELLVGAFFVCLMLIILASFGSFMKGLDSPLVSFVFILTAVAVPFMMLMQFVSAVGGGLAKPIFPSVVEGVVQPLVRLACFISFLFFVPGILAVSIATAFAYLAASLLCVYWLYRNVSGISWASTFSDFKFLRPFRNHDAIALSINFLISNFSQRIDLFLLGFFATPEFIGSYAMSMVVLSSLTIFIAPQNKLLAPALSADWVKSNYYEMALRINNQIKIVSLVVIPGAISLALAIPLLFRIMSGGFRIDWPVLVMMAITVAIPGSLNFSGFALSMTGGQKIERLILLKGIVTLFVFGVAGGVIGGVSGLLFGIMVANVGICIWRVKAAALRIGNYLVWTLPIKILAALIPFGLLAFYLVLTYSEITMVLVFVPIVFMITSMFFIYRVMFSGNDRETFKKIARR